MRSESSPHARTTYEGLRERLDVDWAAPDRLTRQEFKRLSPSERHQWDTARIKWFTTRHWIPTLTTQDLVVATRVALTSREELAVGERGITLSGPSAAGKSTALMKVARVVNEVTEAEDPGHRDRGRIPVAWVDVPAEATPKKIVSAILRFYNVEPGRNDNADDLLVRAVKIMAKAETSLLIFDEVQMLGRGRRTIEASVNQLKAVMNHAPATCLFAGVDLRRHMDSEAANQIWRRCQEFELTQMSRQAPDDVAAFTELVRALSAELRLLDQPDDILMPHVDFLMNHSQGLIGPLRRIVSDAAARAILRRGTNLNAPETLTRTELEAAAAAYRPNLTLLAPPTSPKPPTTPRTPRTPKKAA